MPPNHTRVPKVAAQILHYFANNPEAADTLEGIARWRLLEEQIQRGLQETQQALEWLVANDFLLEESRVSSGKLYRLNQEKAADVTSFLSQGDEDDSEEGDRQN